MNGWSRLVPNPMRSFPFRFNDFLQKALACSMCNHTHALSSNKTSVVSRSQKKHDSLSSVPHRKNIFLGPHRFPIFYHHASSRIKALNVNAVACLSSESNNFHCLLSSCGIQVFTTSVSQTDSHCARHNQSRIEIKAASESKLQKIKHSPSFNREFSGQIQPRRGLHVPSSHKPEFSHGLTSQSERSYLSGSLYLHSSHRLPSRTHVLRGLRTHAATSVKERAGQRFFSSTSKTLSAQVIDGKAVSREILEEIRQDVAGFVSKGKRAPQLTVLLIGKDPASVAYVRNKKKAAEFTGISCDILRLPTSVSQESILEEISFLNKSPSVDGILVQLPVPDHMSERVLCDAVLPQKDVDGFNVLNVGRFAVDQEAFIPATPAGVLEIIRRLGISTKGMNAVVCGRSKNVGLPIALHLLSDGNGQTKAGDATTTICHRHTPRAELVQMTQRADILVSAIGRPGLITADMVKEGAVVIDVGITRLIDGQGKARLVGDVDFEGVRAKAGYITPVPGGVGPVTVAMVLHNTLRAYRRDIDFSVPLA